MHPSTFCGTGMRMPKCNTLLKMFCGMFEEVTGSNQELYLSVSQCTTYFVTFTLFVII